MSSFNNVVSKELLDRFVKGGELDSDKVLYMSDIAFSDSGSKDRSGTDRDVDILALNSEELVFIPSAAVLSETSTVEFESAELASPPDDWNPISSLMVLLTLDSDARSL
jgi:hypothetical protein